MRRALAFATAVLWTGLSVAQTEGPGTGELLATIDGRQVSLPPAAMGVDLEVTGPIVRARLTQTFSNPTGETIDADYVFPLPEGAAVDELTLEVGGRSFVGKIQEKEEAARTFERARAAGKGAALVEQHRPNIFRTRVAGIPAGGSVVVRLGFLDEAEWSDGTFSTTFPMTITPRYHGGRELVGDSGAGAPTPAETSVFPSDDVGTTQTGRSNSTDQSMCSRNSLGMSNELAATVLVDVRATIDAGLPLSEVVSPSHALQATDGGALGGRLPADRDLVLRWRPRTGSDPVAGGLVEDRDDGRYAMAMVVPPDPEMGSGRGVPTQTVFVVDVSGSMAGPSLEQAKAALTVALDRLAPGDTFTLIEFDHEVRPYAERFLDARPSEIADAKAWVASLEARGGTEILPALLHALGLSRRGDPGRLARVVLITDGAVSNEDQVLAAVGRSLGDTRLHIVGIGPAPNRWLMKELAREGRGTFEAIGSIDDVGEKTIALLTRTERAVMTGVTLEWEGGAKVEAEPDPVPDLYAGRPLVVLAKLDPGQVLPKLTVRGRTPRGPVTMQVSLAAAPGGSGIATRWARARVASLEQARVHGADPARIRADVVALAKRFSLVTPYTSFVVVADETFDDGDDEAELPAGGTLEPLLLAIGVVLTGLGLLAARRAA